MAIGLNLTLSPEPGLGTGMILISFRREGTTLLEKEVLKMFVSGLIKISGHFLRTMGGIPSGPRLWEGVRDFKHLRTSEVLKL
ncbi:unnamed protein product [Trichobilharzia regenti]|nr:unnamed protein product [Trichobilharzia regenti]